eukprot:COSAG05_NODE_12322_length_472_cov_1.705094_2_plen_30_part_01
MGSLVLRSKKVCGLRFEAPAVSFIRNALSR